jgi:hypothetical protein
LIVASGCGPAVALKDRLSDVLLQFADRGSEIQNAGMATIHRRPMIDPVSVGWHAPG